MLKPERGKRLRNFVFTWNNYSDTDYYGITDEALQGKFFSYIRIGKEVAGTGTKHLQGYAELVHQTSFNSIKKKYPEIHFEPRRGTQKQAIDYASKDDKDFFEYGTPSKQGSRTDLHVIAKRIEDGSTMRELILDNAQPLTYKTFKVAERMFTYFEKERHTQPEVIWIYGKSGSGKTATAFHLAGGSEGSRDVYVKYGASEKWWDGYDGQPYCIIDDLRPYMCKYVDLINMLDRYPYRLPVKGAFRQLLAKTFIITSLQHPEIMHRLDDEWKKEPYRQLARRITKIVNMDWPDQAIKQLDLPESFCDIIYKRNKLRS